MNDEELLRSFEDCSLPFADWSHRTHVKVAFLYLRDHPFEEAMVKIRTGIQAFNAAHQVPEGPLQGYNETTTYAFARLIHATIAAYGKQLPTPDADSFCETHPQLSATKHILRLFYSPERRGHPDAKYRFIEPDLTRLPECS